MAYSVELVEEEVGDRPVGRTAQSFDDAKEDLTMPLWWGGWRSKFTMSVS